MAGGGGGREGGGGGEESISNGAGGVGPLVTDPKSCVCVFQFS